MKARSASVVNGHGHAAAGGTRVAAHGPSVLASAPATNAIVDNAGWLALAGAAGLLGWKVWGLWKLGGGGEKRR